MLITAQDDGPSSLIHNIQRAEAQLKNNIYESILKTIDEFLLN